MKADLILDIETLVEPVSVSDVDKFMNEYKPPKNYKTPEAILRHREKAQKDAVNIISDERRFSIGGKRMISASLGFASADGTIKNIEVWCSENLEEITKGVAGYIDAFPNFRLIGWNLKKFDLPELIKSFAITKTKLNFRPGKWDVVDLCDYPFNKMKLKDVARAMKLDVMDIDGSNIAELYANGDFETIRKYNANDVKITGEIFLAVRAVLDI